MKKYPHLPKIAYYQKNMVLHLEPSIFIVEYKNSIQYLLENSKGENITGTDQCLEKMSYESWWKHKYICVNIHWRQLLQLLSQNHYLWPWVPLRVLVVAWMWENVMHEAAIKELEKEHLMHADNQWSSQLKKLSIKSCLYGITEMRNNWKHELE